MRVQAMPDLMIDSFIDDVAKRSNIDPAAAETAVGTILSVIQQEANSSTVTQLFDHLPGAADLAQKHAVVAGSGAGMGGALSSLGGKVHGCQRRDHGRRNDADRANRLEHGSDQEYRGRPFVVYQGCRSCPRETDWRCGSGLARSPCLNPPVAGTTAVSSWVRDQRFCPQADGRFVTSSVS